MKMTSEEEAATDFLDASIKSASMYLTPAKQVSITAGEKTSDVDSYLDR